MWILFKLKLQSLHEITVVFFLAFKKMIFNQKMDSNVIHNIADHYAREYSVMERKNDLMELIKNHGNQLLYIFRCLCLVKNLVKNIGFTIEIPSKSEYHFFEDLQKKCFIKIQKRRVKKEPLRSKLLDEVYLTINV